jgi:glyoxylase-like metal-dependent hydrolase (beta-lactamase superfamily II)
MQMKMRVGLVAVLSLAMLGAYLHAQFGTEAAKLDLVKVKDDLYVIHNDFVPGNTTVLITSEGVVLVDDKFEIDSANILAQLKKVTNQPVKYVINTHFHGDHSGGNAKLQALNAQVIASEAARQKMVETKMPGLPNVTLENRLRLYVGGKRVEVHYLGRSHTNGDVVVLFPDHRVLAMGDMFTFGDATPQLVDYAGGGSAVEWTKTVDGALGLDFDTVVPGHGVVTTKQEVRKFRDSTMSLRTKVHDMVSQKKSRAEIEKMLRSDFHFADLHVQVSLDGLIKELQ